MATAKQPQKPATKSYERYHIPNLKRALDVFELLSKHTDGLTLSEISAMTKYSKNSIFRIVCTLQDCGYVLKEGDGRKIVMSRKLAALGYAGFGESNIVEKAMDVLRAMRDEFGESAMIGTLLQEDCVLLEQAPGRHPFKFLGEIGMRIPSLASAPGKAIFAYLPKDELKSRMDKLSFWVYNENTIANKSDFMKEMENIRECGYSIDRGEEIAGVHCVGAPIFNAHGYPIAAVWITGPRERLPETKFAEVGKAIRGYADKVSTRLGYNRF